MDTNVRKAELISIVRENRDKHTSVFRASVDGYRELAMEMLRGEIASLEAGRTPELRVILTRPRDHTRDYDRVIRMLELDTREQILLDERTFAKYVMDQWEWTGEFLRFSSSYAAGATQEAYGVIDNDDF